MKKIGKYEILGTLGRGGMGIVYKALDPDIEREVAIKTIRFDTLTEGLEKEEQLTRVIREAKAAGRLNHPHIITIYDVVRDKDLTYIVMQYVDGPSLQNLIDSGKSFSPQEIVEILKPISEALDFAHQGGIVHRDIKPANVLMDKSGKPFLADFGVARIETSTLTQAGTTVGTLSYMSPEQVKGQMVDKRSDIFALGVILYELLTGKKPFGGDNMSTIVYRIVNEDPQRITDIKKDLPGGYESVVRKALAKNPEERYQSCREMIADLENPSRMAEATRAYELGQDSVGKPKKRKTALAGAGAGILVAVIAAGAYLFFLKQPDKTAHRPQNQETTKNKESTRAARSAGPASGTSQTPGDEVLAKLKESFSAKAYQETVRLAEDVLKQDPANASAKEFLNKARAEIQAAEVSSLLQSGISHFSNGNYLQCMAEMEKVLKIDKDNKDAQKYFFQADTALAKPEIMALIERYRTAEENKDLLTVLSLFEPALADSLQADYRLLFNGYDGIRSVISNVSVVFSSRANATAAYSQLLTAVYKKTGQKKIVLEGQKTWQLRRQGRDWRISAVQ
jgi:serine/threonine protein kinase